MAGATDELFWYIIKTEILQNADNWYVKHLERSKDFYHITSVLIMFLQLTVLFNWNICNDMEMRGGPLSWNPVVENHAMELTAYFVVRV